MAKFGSQSLSRLATCHEDLQIVLHEAIKDAPIDFSITCGHRGRAEQDKAVAEGKSKTPWPTSKHNKIPSLAADFAPVVNGAIPWNDLAAFERVARHILATGERLGIALRWGGDWDRDGKTRAQGDKDERFVDFPHIELAG